MERKVTLIYFPYGCEEPAWAALGYAKIGPKYVHFRYAGENQFPYWTKFEKKEVKIFDGWHQEIVEAVEAFRKAIRQWDENRRKAWQEAEYEGKKLANKIYEEWKKQNPPPTFSIPLLQLSPFLRLIQEGQYDGASKSVGEVLA
ncbi:MAG: hypothetical protein QXJ07_05335 [Candidatus Bathyarchaeia archaeon]